MICVNMAKLSVLPWRRNLIPACREIAIKRKAPKPGGYLSGGVAPFALQPPDDRADQDMGELHDRQGLWHGLIDLLFGACRCFPLLLILKDEFDDVLAHAGCKPRTPVFPQHGPVELALLRDMLKDLDPDLWGVFQVHLVR